MVMVLVMDRELVQLLAVKFSSAMRTDPRKHFERLLPIGLLQLSLGALGHASFEEDGDSVPRDSTTSSSRMLKKTVLSFVKGGVKRPNPKMSDVSRHGFENTAGSLFSESCYMSWVQGHENTRMVGLTHPACCASAHQALIPPVTLSR